MAKQIGKKELEGATEVMAVEIVGKQGIKHVELDVMTMGDAASPEIGAVAPTDAGPDPAVLAASMGVVVAKPSRKAKLKATTAIERADGPPDYEALGASAEAAVALEKLWLAFGELARRSTQHVFECTVEAPELNALRADVARSASRRSSS